MEPCKPLKEDIMFKRIFKWLLKKREAYDTAMMAVTYAQLGYRNCALELMVKKKGK